MEMAKGCFKVSEADAVSVPAAFDRLRPFGSFWVSVADAVSGTQ